MNLNLDRAKERIAHPYTEDELMPLVLFRGNWEMGKAQALWKVALLMMDAEVPSVARIRDTTGQARDLLHMTGIHEFAKSGLDMRAAFARIYNSPSVSALEPRIKEYIRWVDSNTDGWTFLRKLEPIERYSLHSNRKWRYPYKRRGFHGLYKGKHSTDTGVHVPEFYPFFTEKPREEHELLVWAHGLVPKGIPDHWRQDICQDLIVGLLLGDITKGNAATSVPKYISKVFNMYPSKYGPLSIDQELSFDDDRSLHDKLVGQTLR